MQRRGLVKGRSVRGARGLSDLGGLAGPLVCALALAASSPLLTGCASAKPMPVIKSPVTAAELVLEGQRRGLSMQNPLALDPAIMRAVREKLGTWGDPTERLRRLIYFLNDEGGGGFEYAPNFSLTAEEAYYKRRGDCMAYANLFISLARGLGLPAYFVHVSEVLSHYEHKGKFFTSSHVAVGYGSGPSSMVIDFTKENKDWKLSVYRTIDDAAAVALYYNNVAVDAMMSGKLDEAESMLTYLLTSEPQVEELYNNLGVLLNRRGRYEEALSVLQRGIARSPEYKPYFTNGLEAARGAGRADVARDFEERGMAIAERNPYFIFARAMGFYQNAKYEQAAEDFERAASVKPDSPIIYAWLTRAWMSAGDRERGLHAFLEARKLAPKSRVVHDLMEQYPELR